MVSLARCGLMSGGTIPGLLLAGGRARRMRRAGGGDKCLLKLGGRTLLDRVIERAAPQVERLVLNANGDPERQQQTRLAPCNLHWPL